MTLIEVVVAIAVLGILSTASLGVYLASINTSTSQQNREIAITIANESMESVSAWSTAVNPVTGKSSLYNGRSQARVQAAWTANLGVAGVSQTYQVYDSTAPSTSEGGLPATATVPMNGTVYTVNTIIGTCFQPKRGGSCTAASYPTMPSTTPAGFTPLTRVIVIVKWKAGSSCGPSGCSYHASTLIDLNADLRWNTNAPTP